MKARVVLAMLVIVAVAAGVWWFSRGHADRQDLPQGALRGYNVLLVTVDTLRLDRVGAYGQSNGLTPTLDRLASEGLRFDGIRSHVPLTLPSHASLMTGRIPPRHGVRDNGTYRLDAKEPTLAATLQPAGYQTSAFVGAFVLDARFGLARGFDIYDDQYGERPSDGRVEVVERSAEQVTAPATEWIRRATAPWFAWVHLYDPHEPYAPPEPFASRYPSAPYDGEVAYADAALGRMIDDLRSAGRLDSTLVVVTSDHGEGLGEHAERTHGLFAYETTMRVPLLMWCPGRIQPGVVNAAAGLVSVAPTILDLLGIPWTDGDGASLRGALDGESVPAAGAQPIYFESLNANLSRNWAPLTGIVSGDLKLIDLPVPELYDLRADPVEAVNLYARRPDDVRRLEASLDAIAANRAAAAGSSVDTETAARLRSLGYVVAQPSAKPRRFTVADDPKNLVALDTALDDAMKISGRGDHMAAVTVLQKVIQQRPDLPQAYDRLAFVLRASGNPDEAIRVLEQAASKGLADAPALVSLGTLLQETGRLDRSIAVLETAVGMNSHDLEARSRLGTAYAAAGRDADAEREFKAVLEADPQSAEGLTNLGVLYLATQRREEAMATLRQAIAANPAMTGARNALAVAYARSGDLPRAVEEWRQVTLKRPDDPDALYNLGTALLQLGRPDEARPVLQRFIAVAPPRYAKDVAAVRETLDRLQKQP